MQGIKFYEPEVVGDTPEAVEYRGMQNLLAAVKEHVGYRNGKLIFSADGQVGCPLFSSNLRRYRWFHGWSCQAWDGQESCRKETERKVHAAKCHDGSVCTQKQPEWAAYCVSSILRLYLW